jgi:hypothetical protein
MPLTTPRTELSREMCRQRRYNPTWLIADSQKLMRFELFIATRYLRTKRRQVEAFARRLSRAPKSRAPRGTSE